MSTCLECQQPFEVKPQDREILDKLGLPTPSLCATHALQRRLAYRNERYLYRRNCEFCGVSMLAQFSPESYMHVYCRECWYSDKWDPRSYAQDYDPSRSFLDQFFQLLQSVPMYNVFWVGQRENSEYANFSLGGKDVYMAFSTVESEGVLYSKNTDYSRDIVDSAQTIKSEYLYDCVDTQNTYHSAWLTRCDHCSDCYLSRDLTDCQDCFGSVNLQHKRFYWFNEQLTESEYRKRLAEALQNRELFQSQVDRFAQHQLNFPVEAAIIKSSVGCTGHDIHNSNQVRNGVNVREGENLGDVFRVYKSKDSYRECYGLATELSYEGAASPRRVKSIATLHCPDVYQVNYSLACENNQDLFGCIGLRQKKFHILNKEYSPEEYQRVKQRIIEDMKARGEWGEFFPIRFSPQAYNDTVAAEYWPLTQEEVTSRGWRWQNERSGTRGKETIDQTSIPSDISQVNDSFLKEILACQTCGVNFKLQKKELDMLKNFHLPVPLNCPEDRFQHRLSRTYVPELHDRTCQCVQSNHSNHTSVCQRPIQSVYASNRPELVYCKDCYASEVL